MDGPFLGCTKSADLSDSDQLLLLSVLRWYNTNSKRVSGFLEIVERNNGLSLRVIDWLVTNYCKTTPVMLHRRDGPPTDLYRDYQKYLSAYNKKNMDPFARRKRVTITLFGKKTRKSTLGQLNFFRWFLKNKLEEFMHLNKAVVEDDMKRVADRVSQKKRHRKKAPTARVFSGKFLVEFS
ncbi:unknown [Feldmannia species virus]|uniref:Uncharacterized protein n=1 Tax=Feldmannia species virus TaxID=39420 RepID=B5LWG8_9PHYC|nr:hypothetical protein FeldSpV_gp079 [Feldmannia species virus]ACH46831.1 unknown [Feldmannia species virus]